MDRLANKICLVTGAISGIGRAIVELFHQEGSIVIATDIYDESHSESKDLIKNNISYFQLDISQEEDWINAFTYLKQNYGKLDILVNNAGITGLTQMQNSQDPEHFELESWRRVHAINSDGVALGCKYAIQLMKNNQSASIVNISSRSGLVGVPHMAAYAASKAAIRNHTKSVALYCAEMKYSIRCNSIHPAAILTPLWDPMLGTGENRAKKIREIESQIPLGRMGTSLDVAYAALYLASDESPYVTGIELIVDGGILAGSSATPKKHDSHD